ncbi:MAG: hypothetical protein Ct9H300mP22_2040 [Gammaproteobacteria bacterium]|nr:MAG: hypothetical protein Ct9H300mP22_2040 [Gammaproteobacteria bacterium]
MFLPYGSGVHEETVRRPAKRVMMGIWSFLRQFMYTKFIVVVDDDVDIRSWEDVIWASPPE